MACFICQKINEAVIELIITDRNKLYEIGVHRITETLSYLPCLNNGKE